jgi:NAD-dependent deacetylase
MDKIKELQKIINESTGIVFFGGAGVSTESGIPDFRSQDGLYNQKYDYPPEEILSHHFFMEHTKEFYRFYKDKLNTKGFSPNITHITLASLEKKGKVHSVITQNIDGFHQEAGSQNVLELHGSIKRNYCMDCHRFYDDQYVFSSLDIPTCSCGGIIKPDVVLYEESLNEDDIVNAVRQIGDCDMLIVVGTSLVVYPAAGFVRYYNGNKLVLLNKSETQYDLKANLVIHDDIKNIIEELMK